MSLVNTELRNFVGGQPLMQQVTAQNLNRPITAIRELQTAVNNNVRPPRIGDGNVLSVRFAKIVSAGFGDDTADDTSEPRYWLQFQKISENIKGGDTLALVNEDAPGLSGVVRATNLAEPSGSHVLDTDGTVTVLVYEVLYELAACQRHYFFDRSIGGSGVVLFRITSLASGGGKYNGKSLTVGAGDVLGTGDLAYADIGTVAASEDVLALNFDEVGSSGHLLSSSTMPNVFIGYLLKTNSTGVKVVGFSGEPFADCT